MKRCVGTCIDALLLLQLKFVKALQVATGKIEELNLHLASSENAVEEGKAKIMKPSAERVR